MYANEPAMAKRWQKHTPKGKKLPEHVDKKAFWTGFCETCAKHNMSPFVVKQAFAIIPSWGGGQYNAGNPEGFGGNIGYSYLAGVVPFPSVGMRFGGKDGGVSIKGPLPGIAVDSGVDPGWQWKSPRSLWGWGYDKITGNKTPQEELEELDQALDSGKIKPKQYTDAVIALMDKHYPEKKADHDALEAFLTGGLTGAAGAGIGSLALKHPADTALRNALIGGVGVGGLNALIASNSPGYEDTDYGSDYEDIPRPQDRRDDPNWIRGRDRWEPDTIDEAIHGPNRGIL
jgi:hypothetical protein